ncbi:hypothetical protein PR048_014399 [Dryococelus australis]|uniref:DDE-1 domain-containing protein n=1 Tax=Dryococelus australis TaxID=614101 RepID=A0ABQ9HE47_9NEOP|nr:hypothetical protein PR048_014399 [Dryococelus australis]
MSDYGSSIDETYRCYVVHSYLDKLGRKVSTFKKNVPGKDRAAVDENVMTDYIFNLAETLEEVDPSNVYNYDETNLTDNPGSKKVVTKRGLKYPEAVCNASKANISIMMYGSATGELLAPYAVYRSKHLVFESWVMSIMLPVLRNKEGKNVIGHNPPSHTTSTVLKECKRNNTSFLCLPPNSTHLSQPLYVAFFHPTKCEWRKILREYNSVQLD